MDRAGQSRRPETIHPEINPEQRSGSDDPANSRIKILYSNVRSIVNKIDELKHTSYDLKPDIICICETWTNDSILNAYLNIEDYSILCRRDRTDTNQGKGGLLVYVKSGIKATELKTDFIDSYNQCCAISLNMYNKTNLNIVLVYRPHSLYNSESLAENNDKLCDLLTKIPKPYILVGDFNYSDIDWNANTSSSKSRNFLNTVNDMFLTQHVNFPTHNSGTMPDLVFCSEDNIILSTESTGNLGSSDHDMIIIDTQLHC